jgi:hypothetical protein
LMVASLAYSSTLKMKVTCSSETSVKYYRTTRRYIPEYSTIRTAIGLWRQNAAFLCWIRVGKVHTTYIRCLRPQHPLSLMTMTNLAWSFIRPCNIPTNLLNKENSSTLLLREGISPAVKVLEPPLHLHHIALGPTRSLEIAAYSVFISHGAWVADRSGWWWLVPRWQRELQIGTASQHSWPWCICWLLFRRLHRITETRKR